MTQQIEKHDDNRVSITLEIPAEDFNRALDKAFNKHKREFNIPGFRKGKATKQGGFARYGEEIFYEEALEGCVPAAYEAALEAHGIEPISAPRFSAESCNSQDGAVIHAEVAVKPEFTVVDYEGIEAYRPSPEVDDEQIDEYLAKKQRQLARKISITDRPVQEGDTVNLDYSGFIGDEPFAGGTAEDQSLTIGSGAFIPGFEEQLIGMAIGEEREIQVTFPEHYGAEELAGKEATFKVKINGIEEEQLPEIDDEFVKDVDDECDTLAEYREKLRQEIAAESEDQADQFFENEVLRQLIDAQDLELPEIAIEDEIDKLVERQEREMRQYGLKLEDFLGFRNMTLADYREEHREMATRQLKATLILDQLAEQLRLGLTQEDYEAEFERLAEQYHSEPAKLKLSFDNEEGREMLRPGMLRQMAMQKVVEMAKKSDQKPDFMQEDSEEDNA